MDILNKLEGVKYKIGIVKHRNPDLELDIVDYNPILDRTER